MGVLEDIGSRLETDGVGTQGTDLFLGEMPDTPDTCIALFLYGGSPPVMAMGLATGKAVVDFTRVHVRTRAPNVNDAETKALNVYAKLHNLGPVTINGREYKSIQALQRPFQLGPDANDRQIWACNYEAARDGL